MKNIHHLSSLFQLHFAVLLFGLAGLFGKWIDLPPAMITWGRCIFAFAVLSLLILLSKERFALKEKKHYFVFVCMGLILALHWWSFFYSIQISTVAIGLLTFSTFPVFAVFFEPVFFKEKIRLVDIAVAFITFAGIALVVPGFNINDPVTQGVLLGILSGLSFAILQIMNRKYVIHYPGKLIAFYQTGIASIVLLSMVSFGQGGEFSMQNILLLIILGVLCTALAHSFFIEGLKHVTVQTASIIASLEPVYGIIAAALLLHEIPSLKIIIGGIIILSMAVLVSLRR